MSSRRKSSTPCMIRPSPPLEQDDPEDMDLTNHGAVKEEQPPESPASREQSPEGGAATAPPNQEPAALEPGDIEDLGSSEVRETAEEGGATAPQRRQPGGYECKYCPFSTQNLAQFKEHVDASHPNVILNPLYLCAVCNFSTKKFDLLTEHNETRHPGETDFKFRRVKVSSQTVLEQTIQGRDSCVDVVTANELGENGNGGVVVFGAGFPTSRAATPTPIVAGHPAVDNLQPFLYPRGEQRQLENLAPKEQIAAVNINGTVLIPEPALVQSLAHVTPLLQRPPNISCVPKIAVPLNSNKYNPTLDSNPTLITSFNKFPYPTHAELSWLTAASKHPEDQIKVWFTTQRLKQGITWSPEEVEEARKKMFNGSIPPLHQTFTVQHTGSSLPQPSKAIQPVVKTTTLQSIQALASLANGQNRPAVAVSSVTNHVQALKRPLTCPAPVPEAKRLVAEDPRERLLMAPPPAPPSKERLPMAPPPVPLESSKRSVALPFVGAEMRRSPSTLSSSSLSLASSKGRQHPIMCPLVSPKNKHQLPLPSPLFLDMKRPYPAPIIAPPFKNYAMSPASIASKEKHPITHSLLAPDAKLTNSPPLLAPQTRRPTIIQSVRAPVRVPPQLSPDGRRTKQASDLKPPQGFSKVLTPLAEANGVTRGDGRGPRDHALHTHNNGSSTAPKPEPQKAVPTQFPLLERMKGKTSEQLKILEENFQRNSFPTPAEADGVAAQSRLSRDEIDSWFMERRALRDNLEQALLNSMGSGRLASLEKQQQQQQHHRHHQQQQHGHLNGAHKHGGHLRSSPVLPIIAPNAPTPAPCSASVDSQSLGLLKVVFAETRWPSPEQYTQLEAQTAMGRTDIVRWFKDNRSALKTGTLEWMDTFHQINGGGGAARQNGQGVVVAAALVAGSENTFSITREVKTLPRVEDIGRLPENAGPGAHLDVQDWLTSKLRPGSGGPELGNEGQNGGVGDREGLGGVGDREGLGGVGGREGLGGRGDIEDVQEMKTHTRRPQELLSSEKDKDDASGRVTG